MTTRATPDELINLIQRDRGSSLPLVGAGLAAAAGAPSVWMLTRELARRSGVPWDPDKGKLLKVTSQAIDAIGTLAVQQHVADITTGLRLEPTPALIAVCGAELGRVLTTNYDDAIERAALARGIMPVPLLPRDPAILKPPAPGHLHVIHLHGFPAQLKSIILPGASMHALDDDAVFSEFTRATMAPWTILYLGFSLGQGEVHLRHSVRWLGRNVAGSGRHYLLTPTDEIVRRDEDIDELETFGNVTVVPYEKDRTHSEVERVALALAPRAGASGENRERITFVWPLLIRATPGEDEEGLQRRLRLLQVGLGETEAVLSADSLLDERRSLVIAAPGMGKSTLLERLPELDPERTHALARLRDFQPPALGEPIEHGMLRLLRAPDGEPLAAEALEEAPLVARLDGFDEVPEHVRDAAAEAMEAATDRWPAATWIVMSRPGPAAAALPAGEFAVFHIPASRAWAETYLRARSVPPQRIERALLDGYGLGDLLTIPLFAERLADRLLDQRTADVSPLELLVDEQLAACRREARRHQRLEADLGQWLQRVALVVEARGLASAPTDAVASVPGPPGLRGRDARHRLADASLLADSPGMVAFPAKTLQEGLAAHSLLACPDPVAALAEIAIADVDGAPRLRDDIDFTLDLVFEHADHETRARLRTLDELRWARTVATRGDRQDAAEAYDVLVSWHVAKDRDFTAWFGDTLRTPAQALGEIARRWPEVIATHRTELEAQLDDGSPKARSRALTLLGLLETGEHDTAPPWLVPRLGDVSPAVAMQAAGLAGRLHARSVVPALRELLDRTDDHVRRAALTSLVGLVATEDLPQVMSHTSASVRPVAERLLKRLDVDTGLAVVAAVGMRDQLSGWLLERLLETARTDAWTTGRIQRLVQVLDNATAIDIDPARLASAIAHHPVAAVASVQVRDIGGRPYAGRLLLLAIDRLDPEFRAGPEHAELREAIEHAKAEQRDVDARCRGDDRGPRLAARVQAHGTNVDPQGFGWPLTARELTGIDRELLLDLVDRWWPPGPLDAHDDDGWLLQATDAALSIGAAVTAPLTPERWWALLRAHLTARRLDHALHGEVVSAWLHDARPADADAELRACIAAADATALRTLVIASGAGHATNPFTDAVVTRLAQLDPESSGWMGRSGSSASVEVTRRSVASWTCRFRRPSEPPSSSRWRSTATPSARRR